MARLDLSRRLPLIHDPFDGTIWMSTPDGRTLQVDRERLAEQVKEIDSETCPARRELLRYLAGAT